MVLAIVAVSAADLAERPPKQQPSFYPPRSVPESKYLQNWKNIIQCGPSGTPPPTCMRQE